MNLNIHYRRPFFFAVALHILLAIFLCMHFVSRSMPAVTNTTNPINAMAVSSAQLQQQLDAIKSTQQAQQRQQQQKQAEQQAQQQAIQQKIQQQQLQAQKVQQEKIAQEKIQQEQAAALKIQQAQIQQEMLKEQKTQQLAAQKAAAIKQKQLQAVKLATQKLLQQEIADAPSVNQDQTQAQTQQTAVNNGEIDKYKALIIQAISQQWNMPQDPQNTQNGKLLVELAPGGMVISVQIVQSSGDDALDRSARIAVLKASPLPVPADPALFNRFRELNLIVQPQGITAGG